MVSDHCWYDYGLVMSHDDFLVIFVCLFLKNTVLCNPSYVSEQWNDESLHNLVKYLSHSHSQPSNRAEMEQVVMQKAEMLGLGSITSTCISNLDDLRKLTGDGQLKERLIQHLKSTQNTVSMGLSLLLLKVCL